MAGVRAAVLAAGRGLRMGGEVPKTLIPVPGGEPLLHYILQGLKRAGVDDLLMVTGHRAGDVAAFVAERWGDATIIKNARYASWGNFHTVRMAVDQSPGFDLLVVNSDVVVHPDVYRQVADTPGDLVLAVQRRRGLDDEDMRVRLEDGHVLAIGKDLKRAHGHGEFAGVSLLRPDAAGLYGRICTDLEWTGDTEVYYEDVYARMLGQVAARAADVPADGYAEVDVPDDLPAAADVIARHHEAWAAAPAAAGGG